MPKTIFTPRSELICGKLDRLELLLMEIGTQKAVECLRMVAHIRDDAERMERKLAEYKFSKIEPVDLLDKVKKPKTQPKT